jgi:hypothetical protein
MKTKPSGLIAGGHSTSAFEISLSYMCRRFFLSTIRPSTQEFGDNPDDFDGLSRTCGDLNQHIVYYPVQLPLTRYRRHTESNGSKVQGQQGQLTRAVGKAYRLASHEFRIIGSLRRSISALLGAYTSGSCRCAADSPGRRLPWLHLRARKFGQAQSTR